MLRAALALTFFLALWPLAGCKTIDGSEYTFRGPIEIDTTQIRVDGYYVAVRYDSVAYREGRRETGHDIVRVLPMVLWSDGTAALASTWRQFDRGGGEVASLEDALVRTDSVVMALTGQRDDAVGWGAFRLRGDSLFVQVMDRYYPDLTLATTWAYSGSLQSDTAFTLTDLQIDGYDHTERLGDDGLLRFAFRPFAATPTPANWTDEHPTLRSFDRQNAAAHRIIHGE